MKPTIPSWIQNCLPLALIAGAIFGWLTFMIYRKNEKALGKPFRA